MAELIKTRCTQGWLILTDTAIIVELRGFGGSVQKSETLLRSAFVDLDMKRSTPFGGMKAVSMNLAFHGAGGKVLSANLVKAEDAQKIVAILTGRE